MLRLCRNDVLFCLVLLLLFVNILDGKERRKGNKKYYGKYRVAAIKSTTADYNSFTKTVCMQLDATLRARRRTCFLRPDTGPCRADIIQWYFDVKQAECYRFYYGGCQGNGNRFESNDQCLDHCYINTTMPSVQIPHFCSLAFDYGTCFGHYNRWGWDTFTKTCRLRLYSGCGGNQNNFESRAECLANCLKPPNNTMHNVQQVTTCIPFNVARLQ